jgi:DNA-binding XRE family transcriptional regulator
MTMRSLLRSADDACPMVLLATAVFLRPIADVLVYRNCRWARLRQLRLRRGLSQEKLAEMADLHRNYIGTIERGQQNVCPFAIVKLAHALSVRHAKLMEPIL